MREMGIGIEIDTYIDIISCCLDMAETAHFTLYLLQRSRLRRHEMGKTHLFLFLHISTGRL